VKVLLFGGSFDPPHLGHAALLKAAAGRLKPDRIFIIPAFQAPFKNTPRASAADRVRLIKKGLMPFLPRSWRRICRIEEYELRSRRRVYTIETVSKIRAKHPDWKLHFVVGSDAAAAWRTWRSPRKLIRLCRWWTALRPEIPAGRIPSHFQVLRRSIPAVSSTQLRRDLAAGRDTARRIHPRAAAYISRRGLYGTDIINALQKGLKGGRFAHTLAVRDLADALARRWGEDPGRACLAALLHDCGRIIPKSRQPAYVRTRGIAVPRRQDVIRHQPGLLHAYVGADLARRCFGCLDDGVLRAVERHTLAARRMSRLDTILYVADAASEDREHPEAPSLRRLAFKNLDAAFAACLAAKLRHAIGRGGWLHPLSLSLWNALCAKS